MFSDRHQPVPGGTYFFTVRLADPGSGLLVDRVDLLRQCFRIAKSRWPFDIDAAVILPGKMHMIWTLPEGDNAYSARWRLIKSTFSRHVPAPAGHRPGQVRPGDKGIWQRRFWEHRITDREDHALHHHLIVTAPVMAGLVKRPTDWPFTSLHYCRAAARRERFKSPEPMTNSLTGPVWDATVREPATLSPTAG